MDSLPWTLFELNKDSFKQLPQGCKAFCAGSSWTSVEGWRSLWEESEEGFSSLLILAGSRTAEIEGISAAGATPFSRRFTALADAELLLKGPGIVRDFPLPPLKAGVSPALISHVAASWLGVLPMVLAVGLSQQPTFPHLQLDLPSLGPAACLSTGNAMTKARVHSLWQRGLFMGRRLRRPLLIAECVPGGTTTAQAVLTGFGLSVDNLISGSARIPPSALKKDLVERGLRAAGLSYKPSAHEVLAAVGDPFQPVAAGLLIGAREAGQPVLLGGGSQMVAVLALALSAIPAVMRANWIKGVALGTTSWLADETISSTGESGALERLMDLVGDHFGVPLMGLSSGLHFHSSRHKALRDYELGFVKEGVGAGAFALLAQLNGASLQQLLDACDEAVDDLVMDSP